MRSMRTLAANLNQALMYEMAEPIEPDPDDTPESARSAGKERTKDIPKGAKGVPSGLPAQESLSMSQILARADRYLAKQ